MLGFSPLASQPLVSSGTFVPITAAVLAITEDSDTLSATGTLPIFGTATITEADDTVTSVVGNFVIGTASITEADDTITTVGLLSGLPSRLNAARLSGYSRISSRMGSA